MKSGDVKMAATLFVLMGEVLFHTGIAVKVMGHGERQRLHAVVFNGAFEPSKEAIRLHGSGEPGRLSLIPAAPR